jgi:hypothetical protein
VTDDASKAGPKAEPKRTGAPRFAKGKSGNPAGLKRGTKHKRTLLLAAMASDDRADIVAKIIRQAKRGDRASQRLIVDRTEPPRRGSPVKFALPDIVTVADVVAAQRAITVAMSKGRLTPAEAVEVAAVVELARRALETIELFNRVSAIEASMKGPDDEKHS